MMNMSSIGYGYLRTDLPTFERRAPGAPAFAFQPNRAASAASGFFVNGSGGNSSSSSSSSSSTSYWTRAPSSAQQQAGLDARRQVSAFADVGARASTRDNWKYNSAEALDGGLRRPDAQDAAIPLSRLSQAFFSAQNEEVLQEGLRAGVYDLSMQPAHKGPPLDISRQDPVSLRSVMRGVYLERYADTVPAAHAGDIGAQVGVFNAWVWREMVPSLYSAARRQHHYLTHFRENIPVAALTRQVDREFLDDIDGRRRIQFSSMIGAPNGATTAAAGRSQFLQSLHSDATIFDTTDRGNVNKIVALGLAQMRGGGGGR